ncbi:MAG: STAS domain-containing protein [Gammaproteobacteria bacterium]|nr:STAS domain-containing protein [Gammaproteobacteria bacterium]
MAAARFEVAGEGLFRVSGPLDFNSVPGVWEASLPLLREAPAGTCIDLAGVSQVDSAGLALVLEWVGQASLAGRALRIECMPDKLLALARISETEGLLQQA